MFSNGIGLRTAVPDSRTLLLMVHGFPSGRVSRCRQIEPIAGAGFTVCDIDVGGLGLSAPAQPLPQSSA